VTHFYLTDEEPGGVVVVVVIGVSVINAGELN